MLTESVTAESLTLNDYCVPPDKGSPEYSTTLVHTKETTGRFCCSGSWRASSGLFDDPAYSRIVDAYRQLDDIDGTSRVAQLLDCHTLAYFARHKETGKVKIISRKCGLRWCPPCQKAKQAYITHVVAEWLKMFKHPKILTLTIKHQDDPLGEQISNLYKCFQNLKKRKFFKSRVTGGIWFFQIKRSKTDGLYHPHIHCLITGLFVPREQLSKLWLSITGDSPVVDIRAVKDPDTAVRHVARYASAPCDLSNLSTTEITDIIKSLHGRRIVGTWGLAKSISLTPKPTEEADVWESVGTFRTVIELADSDANAKQILMAWKLDRPLAAGVTMNHLQQDIAAGFAATMNKPPPPYLPNFYN